VVIGRLWRPSARGWLGIILIGPSAIVVAFLVIYPLARALDLSFQKIRIARVGAARLPFTLENYSRALASDEFWNAGAVSLGFVLLVTIGCFAVGIGAALLVNQRFPGRRLARLLVALPWAVPEVVAATIWAWMFDGSFGVINWALLQLHLTETPIAWLSQPHEAFAVCTVALIWSGYPFVAVMALAGLQAIPGELYEAAQMDGAHAWQRFRHVTLPALRPVCAIAGVLVVLRVIRDFATVYVITGGGPVGATRSLAIYTYEQAFSFFNIGYAAAVGLITLLLCATVSGIVVRGQAAA
jgi:multiple sugar transport system permease protein